MRLFALLLCLLVCVLGETWAQGLHGTVKDSQSGEVLPFVSVYLSNTTYATETDTLGQYNLMGMAAGRYTLAVRVVGYTPYYQSVTLQPNILTHINISLKPDGRELAEVKVVAQRDKEWEKKFQVFGKEFLGANASAKLCKIVNPWVLELEEKNNTLTAKASQIIEIENRYLGYKILYDLRSFRFDGQQTFYSGLSSFQPLIALSAVEATQWLANREKVFVGSEIHFFQNLAKKTVSSAGYETYLDKPGSNPTVRSRFFYQDQAKKLIRFDPDSLVSAGQAAFQIHLPRRFELHINGNEGAFSIYRDKLCQVAWIETTGRPLVFNKDGILLNPQEWSVSGYLANLRMAETLPINFQGNHTASVAKRLSGDWQEYPVFTSDQPYYRPGQTVSIAGQMQYSNPAYRDSLSRLIRVELFSSEKKQVYSGRWIVQEGAFQGQFQLPESLVPGMYLLRIYSQWMRNFSQEIAVLRWLPVIGQSEKPATHPLVSDSLLSLSYTRKDSLIHWQLSSSPDINLSFASMSVLDNETTPLAYPDQITPYSFSSISFPEKIRFPMERGINLNGSVTGKKEKPVLDAQVVLVVPRVGLSFMSQTDASGDFHFTDLPIEGEQQVILKAMTSKGKPAGTIQIFPDSSTLEINTAHPPDFPTEATLSPINIVYDTDYAAKAIQLNEIAVKAKRTPPPPKVYRQADYVVQGKDLQNALGSNFLVALQGRVPGLDIREVRDADGFLKLVVYVRGGSAAGFSTSAKNQPLIMVDGVPFQDINQIASISPSSVERVEVVTRAEPMLGMRGYGGVISVFTKQGITVNSDESVSDQSKTFLLEGYTLPRTSSNTSIVWLPDLNLNPLGSTEGSLPALPAGQYRLVIEGYTLQGHWVMASTLLKID